MARRVKFYSHGTRQKIGLVAAMQHDPALVLLDEPTNGLDPLVQQAFREVVTGLAQRGRAIFFSSHVLSEIESVCHRVAILREGELVALETMAALREKVVRKMTVRFAGPMPSGLAGVAGVGDVETNGDQATLWIRGDVNPILRALAAVNVADLVFPEAELEDIFMAYYRDQHRAPRA